MATSYNQIPQDVSLSVEPIFKELMKASIGRGSIYLKAKETILDYVNNGELDKREKASIITKSITEMATGMTAQTMQAALKIAQENRDAPYALTKVREDTKLVTAQVAKLEKDTDKADKDIEIATMAIKKAQAELYRDFGVNVASLHTDVLNLSGVTDFTLYGTKHESIKMAQANVYNGYATSYRQNGLVTLAVQSGTGYLEAGTFGDNTGLSYWQGKVAERNEEGFDDNMRQHVANSSATMVSMLLSSEDATLVPLASQALDKWSASVNYLNTTRGKVAGSILITASGTFSKASGMTISGTTISVLPGTSVLFTLTKVSGNAASPTFLDDGMLALVQINNTWSTTVPNTVVNQLVIGDVYKVSAIITDETGATREHSVNKTVVA